MKRAKLKIAISIVALVLISILFLINSQRVGEDHQNHPPYYVSEVEMTEGILESFAIVESFSTEDSFQEPEKKDSDLGYIIAVNVVVVLIIITGSIIFTRIRKNRQK